MKNIGIIGAGNMGRAFYEGLKKEFPVESLFVCDSHAVKLEGIPGEQCSVSADAIISKCDAVILAIKPQMFSEFVESLSESLSEKVVISIMAGISLDTLREKTGSAKIVRSMPNLPVQVREGLIGWIATDAISDDEKVVVKKMFGALGSETEVKDEEMIDSITALSGSGPAYFFYLCEEVSRKAEELGFSEEEARKIAEQTFVGSAKLLKENDKSAKEWREAVTSKGGTTEAAINSLNDSGVDKLIATAIDEAKNKSKSLNQ